MRYVRAITALGAAFFLVVGLWALIAPRSFYEVLATYPPYNEHLFHDIGAFQIGLGVTGFVGLVRPDGLGSALAGLTSAAVLHTLSHILDRDLGGRATDPWSLGLLALVLALASIAYVRRRSP